MKESIVNDLSFEGYNFVSNHRANRIGGELGSLSTKLSHNYKILPEVIVSDANIIESLFVEIFIPRYKNMVIGVIYRPPSENILEFIEKVNEIISGVTKGNKYLLLAEFLVRTVNYGLRAWAINRWKKNEDP